MNIKDEIRQSEEEKAVMIRYLYKKADIRDWHGVADAAMDLRVIESRIKTLDELGN